MATVTVCSTNPCRAQAPRVSRTANQAAVPALLPRLKCTALAAGAAALLTAAAPAVAAVDLALGEEVFNNNCGSSRLCSSPASSNELAVSLQVANGSDSSAASSSSGSSSGKSSSSRTSSTPWAPGAVSNGGLLRHPLLRVKQAGTCMLLQAACHTGGLNSVQPEKTLERAALEQYLDGGFNVNAIIKQVENGKGAMPAWAGRLDEDQIESVANWVFKQAEGNLW